MATTYTVVSGDTLGKIAASTKVALADLVAWNDIKDPDKIVVGQVIRLTDPAPTHVVVAGDTLNKLAATHKVTVDDLVRWNGIKDPNKIVVGQVLKLSGPPAPPAPPAPGAGEQIYVVKAGDTVSELAEKFKLRWVDIAAVNKLADMDLIYVGQKLIIPAQGVARGPVPPATS
jgi:LysM repeat protein